MPSLAFCSKAFEKRGFRKPSFSGGWTPENGGASCPAPETRLMRFPNGSGKMTMRCVEKPFYRSLFQGPLPAGGLPLPEWD